MQQDNDTNELNKISLYLKVLLLLQRTDITINKRKKEFIPKGNYKFVPLLDGSAFLCFADKGNEISFLAYKKKNDEYVFLYDLVSAIVKYHKKDISKDDFGIYLDYLKRNITEKEQEIVFDELPNREITITDKNLAFALTDYEGNSAYLLNLDESYRANIDIRDGRITEKENALKRLDRAQLVTRKNGGLDKQLARSLFSAVWYNQDKMDGYRGKMRFSDFKEYLEITLSNSNDPNIQKLAKRTTNKEFLAALALDANNAIGFMPNGNAYAFFNFESFIEETDVITFSAPYIVEVINELNNRNVTTKTDKKTGNEYKVIKPYYSKCIHSNIYKVQDKYAVEIVHELVRLLMQRGTAKTPDKKTWIDVKYSTIINHIPMLQGQLEADETALQKNQHLRRHFSRAFELMHTHTDLFDYFVNLEINEVVPTSKTLNNKLIMSHFGLKKDE